VALILVHRLKGEPFFVNADLIDSVEATPDTVLSLVDGRRVVIADAPEEIVERIIHFRAAVLVAAEQLRAGEPAGKLVLLQGEGE
jgi:flagellar protein FlbD